MPIGPGSSVELARLYICKDVPQVIVTEPFGETLHIVVVADVHHLRGDPLRCAQRLIWRLPPDILRSEPPKQLSFTTFHGGKIA